ncbi:MAG TPA: FAD-binding oxidoreductase [Longimicrobiales bacterium]|nr:FAD-binding oxidoreductase [Longimicrobiales bacterium]
MNDLTMATLDRDESAISGAALDELSARFSGDLLTPSDDGYDEARAIWNAMIDRRPALIAMCESANDIAAALRFAADHGLLVSVRGAGHNIAGNAVCDGGLMISLDRMRKVDVDPEARVARVQPGATLADVDAATQEHGLATPVGVNSTTGIAGLTLGGGFGWLSRAYGMTIDNLIAADVVLPDGRKVRASADEEPDLFWAIRGGGGNFGVVSAFEFHLHPVGPEILSGLIVHPGDAAADFLRFYRDFAPTLPDDTAVFVVLRKAPPLPFLPEEWHGRDVVVVAAFHGGDMAEGERILQPLREWGDPIADVIGPHPYAGWQQAFDPLLEPGARNYWKSHDFTELSDGFLDVLTESASELPTAECEVFLIQVGGEMGRVAPDATAYPNRHADYMMNVHTRWRDPSDDEACVAWARRLFNASTPYAAGSVYVNFMPSDENDAVERAYGPHYGRLAKLKARYDPQNLLRMNQNIRPAAS